HESVRISKSRFHNSGADQQGNRTAREDRSLTTWSACNHSSSVEDRRAFSFLCSLFKLSLQPFGNTGHTSRAQSMYSSRRREQVTYYRWRQEFARLKTEQVKRLKDLELEKSRLRKAVSDLTPDKLILQKAARGNF